jgi:hypothetical protein
MRRGLYDGLDAILRHTVGKDFSVVINARNHTAPHEHGTCSQELSTGWGGSMSRARRSMLFR